MNEVYLLTGGNIGNREDYLLQAGQAIGQHCGRVVRTSATYETAAWGTEEQPAFLNQAIQLETALTAPALLMAVLDIEKNLGRKRSLKYGPRTIDIDILLYNDETVNLPGLTIPHPEMPFRRFVLTPLCELAAAKVHPVLHKTIARLLLECTDGLAVHKFS